MLITNWINLMSRPVTIAVLNWTLGLIVRPKGSIAKI